MASPAAATAQRPGPPGGPSVLNVGTIVWLASELMFFSGLFAAYFTLRATNDPWPSSGVELETPRTAVATLVLIASSFTMHAATAAALNRDRRRAATMLGVTALLGALFVSNQALEWAQASFSIDDDAYGSIFYLMTGFHGLHVIGGLGFMIAVLAAIAGESRAPTGRTVEVCGYYWHFVDVVWVAMFTVIYVLQ